MDAIDKLLLGCWVVGGVGSLLFGTPETRKRFYFTTAIGLALAWATS